MHAQGQADGMIWPYLPQCIVIKTQPVIIQPSFQQVMCIEFIAQHISGNAAPVGRTVGIYAKGIWDSLNVLPNDYLCSLQNENR